MYSKLHRIFLMIIVIKNQLYVCSIILATGVAVLIDGANSFTIRIVATFKCRQAFTFIISEFTTLRWI